MQSLANDSKFYYCLATDAAASNTDADGAVVDTQGFDGCVFVTAIADSASTGVATLNVKQCDTSGGTYAALSGASATATCSTNDDLNTQLLVVDVYRPQERYLKANITSATANIAFEATYAILYNGRNAPVTQDSAEVADLTVVASPAES